MRRWTMALVLNFSFCTPLWAQQPEHHLHFIIPGGVGGGWDTTARAVGQAMKETGIVDVASFENLSGGGGTKAIYSFLKHNDPQPGTLMVHSAPIIIRSLRDHRDVSYQDMIPIAGLIADYGAIAVAGTSEIKSLQDLRERYQRDPHRLALGGGSMRGSMDHLLAAKVFKELGWDPHLLRYVPYDGGGKALTGILSGEVEVIMSGLGEVIDLARSNTLRILAITAPQRSTAAAAEDIPTFMELGVNVVFTNWRGFFAAPGLDPAEYSALEEQLQKLSKEPRWQQIRERYGWAANFLPQKTFKLMLQKQEGELRHLMTDLGFIAAEEETSRALAPIAVKEAL